MFTVYWNPNFVSESTYLSCMHRKNSEYISTIWTLLFVLCFCFYSALYHPDFISKTCWSNNVKTKIIKLSLITKNKQTQTTPSFVQSPWWFKDSESSLIMKSQKVVETEGVLLLRYMTVSYEPVYETVWILTPPNLQISSVTDKTKALGSFTVAKRPPRRWQRGQSLFW